VSLQDILILQVKYKENTPHYGHLLDHLLTLSVDTGIFPQKPADILKTRCYYYDTNMHTIDIDEIKDKLDRLERITLDGIQNIVEDYLDIEAEPVDDSRFKITIPRAVAYEDYKDNYKLNVCQLNYTGVTYVGLLEQTLYTEEDNSVLESAERYADFKQWMDSQYNFEQPSVERDCFDIRMSDILSEDFNVSVTAYANLCGSVGIKENITLFARWHQWMHDQEYTPIEKIVNTIAKLSTGQQFDVNSWTAVNQYVFDRAVQEVLGIDDGYTFFTEQFWRQQS
jgi:hypothetical protein